MSNSSQFSNLDEQGINKFHWRMVITAGMGFFTDAYDLFVIGIVTALLRPIWHLSMTQLAVLNGTSLAAAGFGAVFFGMLADRLGRKRIYGIEVLILFFGAIFSALSTSFVWLMLSRIFVGIGIGGDYPTSAVVASEHANRKNRGFLVLLVFAMQALGLVVGPLLASMMLAFNIPHHILWRLLIGFGAIPAAGVFYLRRMLAESPRFKMVKASPVEVSRVVCDITGLIKEEKTPRFKEQKLFSKKWLKCLIGTAGAWFLLDVAFYGNGVSSVLVIKSISPHVSLLGHTLLSCLVFLIFAVPGYFLAAKYIDRIGRKPLQITGFLMMAICYLLIALIPHIQEIVPLFIAIFGLSFFFVNFGPNTTTFLIPSEIYPTKIRATAHGLSAAIGKFGAFLGAFFLPLVLHSYGMSITMSLLSFVCLIGIFTTLLVPEMKAVSLDDTEELVS